MKRNAAVLALVICFATFCAPVQNAPDAADAVMVTIRPEAIRADMQFLADDLLEGRGTGTRGHEIAARFVASQFQVMGLAPAGELGTYFQNVPLRSITLDRERCALSITRDGKARTLTFGQDFYNVADAGRSDVAVEAGVVYVGFGVTATEQSYDDYADVDTKGKIVAILSGAPANFEAAIRAHYSSYSVKAANAAAHGAVGAVVLDSPDYERRYSFRERVRDSGEPDLRWLDDSGNVSDYVPELRGTAYLSMDATLRLLEGSGKTLEELVAAAGKPQRRSFPLGITAKIHTASAHAKAQSPNVLAVLPGSDPKLKDEFVLYSAHLDHLGIGEPVNGDNIYNGAIDNASGSATMLEIARAYSRMNPRPRRSIVFAAVTGEEEGLRGSDYFAHYPTVRKDTIVADINVDGNLALLWPVEDVIVRGGEHCTLGTTAAQAARRMNLEVTPDPVPELVFFIRSDQYSFVKQGIPSVFLGAGTKSSNPEIKPQEIIRKWRQTTYHKPQDDMTQTFDFESGAKYARFALLLGYLVAEHSERPAWNVGDFFGSKFGRAN